MQLNLFEFHFFNFNVNFNQKLDSTTFNYQAKSVLIVLIKCLRDSTYIWFNTQNFISLHNFKTTLIKIFLSFTTFFVDINFNSIISTSSLQYHNCSQCFAKFSSITKLLQHAQKNNCSQMTCKHCEKDFNSNNKFHEHVRLKHVRRFINSLKTLKAFFKSFQSSILVFKTWQTSIFDASFKSFFTFSIVFRKFVKTLKHRLKEKRNKHVNLSFTSFVNSFASRTFFHASQSTLLFSKALSSLILQTSFISFFTFSYTSSLRHQSINHVTKRLFFKLYMIIDDLYIMFHEKSFKKTWLSYKKECFFRCLIKLVSSTILNSLHWHSQSIAFVNLLRFRHHNQLELYSIESQKLLIWRSMKLQA